MQTLWRYVKLGFFVGWGVAATVVSACGGSTVQRPIDSGADVREAASQDAGLQQDAGAQDGGAPDDGPRDATGWDVPLE
jgi:hypothetical protein